MKEYIITIIGATLLSAMAGIIALKSGAVMYRL